MQNITMICNWIGPKLLHSPLPQTAISSPSGPPAIQQTKVCWVLLCATRLHKDLDSLCLAISLTEDFLNVSDNDVRVPALKACLASYHVPLSLSSFLPLSGGFPPTTCTTPPQ